MNEKFVRCEFCKMEIPPEMCRLAAYRTVIDGKKYVFCCSQCAQRYESQRQRKK